MPISKATLRARLLAHAEAAIDEILREKKPADVITLSEIEQLVLKAGQKLEQGFTAELATESGQTAPSEWPNCPRCGRRLTAKGKHRRRVAAVSGEVELERDYYYCRHCREGFFPPG